MSFASDIKIELCRAEHSRAQLEILLKGAFFAMCVDGGGLVFSTECKKAAVYIKQACEGAKIDCGLSENTFRTKTVYTFRAPDKKYAETLPDCSDDAEFGAFLRGVFLVCGLAANPEKGYQLEFFLHEKEKCEILLRLIEEHGMTAKLSSRRGSFFLYVKDSEQLSDMLTYMGAMLRAVEIMNVKIYKEVRNNVNRSVNCEAANLNKTITAAQKQKEDIDYITEKMGIGFLRDDLAGVAEIRSGGIELSLSDIGKKLDPPISRSGVNHRLRRISEIADRLRKENGDL